MVCHCRGYFFTEWSLLPDDQHNALIFTFYFLTRLGYEAVLIFFVLSGSLVGGKAIIRLYDGTFQFRNYAIDRFARIMLPLVSALLFYLPICIFFNIPINPLNWIGNLLSLQGILTNSVFGPLWSLSYEVWFYIIMFAVALVCGAKAKKGKWYFGTLLLICSLLVFVKLKSAYLFVWLLGALVFARFPSYRIKEVRIWCIISALILTMLIVLLQITSGSNAIEGAVGNDNNLLRDCLTILFGFTCAIFIRCIIEMVPTGKITIKINNIGTKLAAFSYTLYLVHTPVFILLEKLGAPKSESINLTSVGLFIIWGATAMIVSYLLYLVFERNTPAFKNWLKKIFIK